MNDTDIKDATDYLGNIINEWGTNDASVTALAYYAESAYRTIVNGEKDTMGVLVRAVARAYDDGVRDGYLSAMDNWEGIRVVLNK